MRCVECGNENHPKTALFCVRCGKPLSSAAKIRTTETTFPGLFDLRCWLEVKEQRKGFFGPYCRAFGICFTVMSAPKQAIAVDGKLHLMVAGILNKAHLELDVPVRKEEFAVRRFDLMTTSFESSSYVYRHAQPVIPVPTDGGCKVDLTLIAGSGEVYKGSRKTFFTDHEPDTGPRLQKPWTD